MLRATGVTRRRSTLPNTERRQRLAHRVVSCTLCRHLNDERDWGRIGSRIRKMITLHAGESNGALVLWGEESRDDGVRPTSRRRRRTKVPYISPYPFAASADGLAGALEETWLGLKPTAGRACHVTAWLPTRGDSPIPSSTLIAEPPGPHAKARLAPWAVAAYRLSTAEAVELLCASIGKRTLASGVIVGSDLVYWAEALRFAGSMVARQQFLPGLTTDTDEHRATWDPVFIGMDAERLAGLARRMPAVARALSEPDAAAPPERPSTAVLKQFMATLVDYLVRTATSDAFPPADRRRKNKPTFDSVHDSWLHALRSKDGVVAGRCDRSLAACHTGPRMAPADRGFSGFPVSPLLPPGRTKRYRKNREGR